MDYTCPECEQDIAVETDRFDGPLDSECPECGAYIYEHLYEAWRDDLLYQADMLMEMDKERI